MKLYYKTMLLKVMLPISGLLVTIYYSLRISYYSKNSPHKNLWKGRRVGRR